MSTNPLAPLEALAEEWERYGPGTPMENVMGQQSVTIDTATRLLRAALTEARALLGEVSVREEFGIRYDHGDIEGGYELPDDAEFDRVAIGEAAVIVRRTHTTHTSEWEVVTR